MPNRKTIFWLLAAAVLYFIAWNVGSGWLYILAAVMLSVPLFSIILARLNTGGLTTRLESPAEATQGDRLTATLTITNGSVLPRYLIQAEVEFAGSTKRILVPVVGGRSSRQASITFTGVKRGIFAGAEINLSSSAPFGITTSRRRQTAESPLVVFPRSYPLGNDWASGQGNTGYMLASTVPTRKVGGDYLGVRDYRPEDSPRSIHWRTTARTGSLAVIEFAHQVAINPVIVLDNWRDADFASDAESSFETAVSIAATLASREARHNRRFAIGSSPTDAASRGMSHQAEPALLWLSGVQPDRGQPLDLHSQPLPWPGSTPVIIMASHKSYAEIAGSDFLASYPHAVVIMLDWRRREPDSGRNSRMLDDGQLERLADRIEAQGGRFVLIDTADQVERCLSDL